MIWLEWGLGAAFVLACLVAFGYRLLWLGATERADAGWARVSEQHEQWGRDMDTWLQREREWRASEGELNDTLDAIESKLDRCWALTESQDAELAKARAEGYGREVLPQ